MYITTEVVRICSNQKKEKRNYEWQPHGEIESCGHYRRSDAKEIKCLCGNYEREFSSKSADFKTNFGHFKHLIHILCCGYHHHRYLLFKTIAILLVCRSYLLKKFAFELKNFHLIARTNHPICFSLYFLNVEKKNSMSENGNL